MRPQYDDSLFVGSEFSFVQVSPRSGALFSLATVIPVAKQVTAGINPQQTRTHHKMLTCIGPYACTLRGRKYQSPLLRIQSHCTGTCHVLFAILYKYNNPIHQVASQMPHLARRLHFSPNLSIRNIYIMWFLCPDSQLVTDLMPSFLPCWALKKYA